MKRRHPKQIMDPAELSDGEDYALVFISESGGGHNSIALDPNKPFMTPVTFVGTVDGVTHTDAYAAIDRHRGWHGLHLTFHREFIVCGTVNGLPTVYGLWRGDLLAMSVVGFRYTGTPDDLLTDPPGALCGDGTFKAHKLVVPLDAWMSDEQVYVTDWGNPGGSCVASEDWADEEARLRAKKDMELRRLLGFS